MWPIIDVIFYMLTGLLARVLKPSFTDLVHFFVGTVGLCIFAFTGPLWSWALLRLWTRLISPCLQNILSPHLLALLRPLFRYIVRILKFIDKLPFHAAIRNAVWGPAEHLKTQIGHILPAKVKQCSGIMRVRNAEGDHRCEQNGTIKIGDKWFCRRHAEQGRRRVSFEASEQVR